MKKLNYWNAILLALFGGIFGIQEFYVGRTFLGILALLFWWTCIPVCIAYLEMIYWLFIGEDSFNNKYNKNISNKPLYD